jgi:hypothetical protein
MSTINDSSLLVPDDKTSYLSPRPSLIPLAFASGCGLAFVAIVILFQFIFKRIDSASTETRVVRQLECIHGLSKIVISSLPTFKYNKSRITSDDEVCSVCLEPFGEGEIVRELPRCRHLFHTECIDMWLYSHTTCPMCRSVIGVKESRKKVAVEEPTPALPPV